MGSKHGNLFCDDKIMRGTHYHDESYHSNLDQDLSAPTNRNQSGNGPFSVDVDQWSVLPNRGAIIPALKSIGLSDEETRRAWAAFGSGAWSIHELCCELGNYVRKLPEWK